MVKEISFEVMQGIDGAWTCGDTVNTISSILGGFVGGVTGVAVAGVTKNPYVAYGAGGAVGGAVYGVTNGVLNKAFC